MNAIRQSRIIFALSLACTLSGAVITGAAAQDFEHRVRLTAGPVIGAGAAVAALSAQGELQLLARSAVFVEFVYGGRSEKGCPLDGSGCGTGVNAVAAAGIRAWPWSEPPLWRGVFISASVGRLVTPTSDPQVTTALEFGTDVMRDRRVGARFAARLQSVQGHYRWRHGPALTAAIRVGI